MEFQHVLRLADNLQDDLMMVPRSLYFIQSSCDRCNAKLTKGRTMSFFSNETICLECGRKEEEIRTKIRQKEGADADLKYQGFGLLPKVEVEDEKRINR